MSKNKALKQYQALGRMKKGKMNKTEERYATMLKYRMLAGEIAWYAFEPLKLRLAKNTYYEPDFLVMTNEGYLEFHEVKGFWRDDARVKIKVAAEAFPFFRFVAVQYVKKAWKYENF